MATLTESRHAGEFLISQANGNRSREVATVKSGQDLVAGQVVQFSAGELIAASGDLDTAGDLDTQVAGIIWDNVDATGGAVANCLYIARDAEVKDAALTYPDESTAGGEKAATVASLAALGIIVR